MLNWIGKLWTNAGGKPIIRKTKAPPDKEQTVQISEIKSIEVGQEVLRELSESTRREHVPLSHDICDILHNEKRQWNGKNRSNGLADKGADCANVKFSACGCEEVKDNKGACKYEHQIETLNGQNAAAVSLIINTETRSYMAETQSLKNSSYEVAVSKVNHDGIKILHSTSFKGNVENDKYLVKLKHDYDGPKNLNRNLVSVNEKEAHLKAKNSVIKTLIINTQKLNNSHNDKTTVNNRLPYISQTANLSSLAVSETVPFHIKESHKSVVCINNLSADMGSTASRPEEVVNDTRPQHLVKISNNEISTKHDNIKSAVIEGCFSEKTSEPQERFNAVSGGNISVKPLSPDSTKGCSKGNLLCDISDSSSSEIFLDPSNSTSKNNEPHRPLKCPNDVFSLDKSNFKDKKAEGLDLSLENVIDLSECVNGFHNCEGNLCTIGNQRFIRTILQDSKNYVYVNIGVKEFSGAGTKLGCRVLWRDQSPIPLSTLKDGRKVKFDAIFMPERMIYQALVIWEKTKPRYVTEPSLRSYIWIDTRVLTCEEIVTKFGNNCVLVHYDQKKVSAEFSKASVFVDGKKANITDLCKASSATPIYAAVSRLMTGIKGAEFSYVCSCVWSGIRPCRDMQPSKMFQHGEVYRLNSQNVFVQNSSPYRLYCDWPSFLEVTENNCIVSFEIENHKFSKPLLENKLFVGKFRAQPTLSLKLPVTAHIQKISQDHWLILQIHPPKKEKDCDVSESTTLAEAEVDSKAGKNIQVKVLPENNPAALQISEKIVKLEQTPKTSSANGQKKLPQVVQAATGQIFCVKGNYGILKIRHREIAGYGEIISAFHRSVAYVDQWPLYKDVPFDEQLADLLVGTWHCTLRRCQKVIEGVQVEYEAALAWQGRKPTKDIITFYKKEPNSSDFFYCESYNTDVQQGNLVIWNSNYDSRQGKPDGTSSLVSAGRMYASTKTGAAKTKGATAASPSIESLSELMETLILDDLYPTSAADDERDIVEVGAVE